MLLCALQHIGLSGADVLKTTARCFCVSTFAFLCIGKHKYMKNKTVNSALHFGIAALVVALLCVSVPCSAQDSLSVSGRKKVAVVLSGGGAKGVAHIGVLKVLERAGIPIDIITGTSMGSIVGGLYSVGYDAETLDSIVRVQDWERLLFDKEEYNRQSIEDRDKQNTYFFRRNFSLKKKKLTDGGVVAGRNLSDLFNSLVGEYADSMAFDKFPIPFACIATDIVENTEHVFHSGRLPQAMRASMAIPGVFSPVRMNKEVLVDGGLRNNFPADVAREMGADIIIGVTLQGPPKTADDLTSAGSVISQIVDVNCKNKYNENLSITDLPIRVDTHGYSASSFNKTAIDSLLHRGEEAALTHWDELLKLKENLGLPSDYKSEKLTPPNPLAEKAPEERLREPSAGLGVRFDSEELVSLQLNANLPFRTKIPTALDLTLRLGERIMVRADYSAFRDRKTQLTTPKFMGRLFYMFKHDKLDVYERGSKFYNITYNQHAAGISLLNFNIRNFNFDVGVRWDYYDVRDFLSEAKLANSAYLHDDHYFSYRVQTTYSSEDKKYFTTRGAHFRALYSYYTDNFATLEDKAGLSEVSALWRMSFTAGKRLTFQPMLYGRMLFGSVRPAHLGNMIGGAWFGHYVDQQMPFAGLGHIERTGSHVVAAQLNAQQRIATNNFILARVSVAQQSNGLGDLFKTGTLWGLQAGYYYNTIFGPLGADIGYSNKSRKLYFFVNLGFEF